MSIPISEPISNNINETYHLKIKFKTSWYSEPLYMNSSRIPINGTFELVNNERELINYDVYDENLLFLRCIDNNTLTPLNNIILNAVKNQDAFYALRNIQGHSI